MPLTSFNCQNVGSFDLSDVTMFSSASIYNEYGLEYQYLIWYPTFVLTNIPLSVSRDLKAYGTKYYLGEVAYINFGAIAATEFVQFDIHQGKLCAGLPVPIFINNTDNQDGSVSYGLQLMDRLRARSLSWSFSAGVTFRLDIAWVRFNINYIPGQTSLEII